MPIHDWTRVYPGLFHDFHQSWSIRIKDAMNAGLLPEGLTALVEQRTGPREADVLAVDSFHDARRQKDTEGGVMIAEPPSTKIVRKSTKEHYAERANRIVVKHNLGRTVAVIEIVSPGNKDSRPAFTEFLEKSLGYIDAGVHLMVVDLFPPTKRDPHGLHRAIWDHYETEDLQFEFTGGKDRILASYDAGRVKGAYVEPVTVGDSMPDMPLFLVEGMHIRVPLESTYQATWSALPKPMQMYVETGRAPGQAESTG
jgi:hypothetical protein